MFALQVYGSVPCQFIESCIEIIVLPVYESNEAFIHFNLILQLKLCIALSLHLTGKSNINCDMYKYIGKSVVNKVYFSIIFEVILQTWQLWYVHIYFSVVFGLTLIINRSNKMRKIQNVEKFIMVCAAWYSKFQLLIVACNWYLPNINYWLISTRIIFLDNCCVYVVFRISCAIPGLWWLTWSCGLFLGGLAGSWRFSKKHQGHFHDNLLSFDFLHSVCTGW